MSSTPVGGSLGAVGATFKLPELNAKDADQAKLALAMPHRKQAEEAAAKLNANAAKAADGARMAANLRQAVEAAKRGNFAPNAETLRFVRENSDLLGKSEGRVAGSQDEPAPATDAGRALRDVESILAALGSEQKELALEVKKAVASFDSVLKS
jgi:hypothetical protein